METLQALQKRITTTGKLQSIVKSMKTLSAVNIRQYERAVQSLDNYLQTIELGLLVALKKYKNPLHRKKASGIHRGLVVFGSDQGLCGRFNENLAAFFERKITEKTGQADNVHILVIGARVAARLEGAGFSIEEQFWVPGSINGINTNIYQILLVLDKWQQRHQLNHIDMFFNRHKPGTAGEPYMRTLLPIDNVHLQRLAQKKWQGRSLPQYSLPPDQLFSALMHQYFFVSLFRAQAESLESEQASRLRSMQNAEKNISEHLEELQAHYSIERQSTITSELLDLVAGFKSVAGKKKEAAEVMDPLFFDYLSKLFQDSANSEN